MGKMWKWAAIILAVVLVWMNWDKVKGMLGKKETTTADAVDSIIESSNDVNI